MGRTRRRLAVAGATIALALGAAPSSHAALLLPDFDQEAPWGLVVEPVDDGGEAQYRLGFFSAVDNVGNGTARLFGHRDDTSTAGMTVKQVVDETDGTGVAFLDVGTMRFVTDPTHRHWHFMRFETYELRDATSPYGLVRPDEKQGFCLGDRYDADESDRIPGEPAEPVFTQWCYVDELDRLDADAGISPGYGDVYEPLREGQYIDITGVPAGRYNLVHRVNPDHKLRERTFENNTASRLIEVTYPDGPAGAPEVTTLDVCRIGARCGTGSDEPIYHPPSDWLGPDEDAGPFTSPPGAGLGQGPGPAPSSQDDIPGSTPSPLRSLSHRQAVLYARTAMRDRFWAAPARSVRSCTRVSRTSARCRISWRRRGQLYQGNLSVRYTLRARALWWRYTARVTRRGARPRTWTVSGARRAAVGQ